MTIAERLAHGEEAAAERGLPVQRASHLLAPPHGIRREGDTLWILSPCTDGCTGCEDCTETPLLAPDLLAAVAAADRPALRRLYCQERYSLDERCSPHGERDPLRRRDFLGCLRAAYWDFGRGDSVNPPGVRYDAPDVLPWCSTGDPGIEARVDGQWRALWALAGEKRVGRFMRELALSRVVAG
jgi:hypothetical protein